MYTLFSNTEEHQLNEYTSTLYLISSNSLHYNNYLLNNHILKEGSKKECIDYMNEINSNLVSNLIIL